MPSSGFGGKPRLYSRTITETNTLLSVRNKKSVPFQKMGKVKERKNMYQDKTLVCKECGEQFIFSAGEQEFYAERGFQNEPQRCKSCRDKRKNVNRTPREYFTATRCV